MTPPGLAAAHSPAAPDAKEHPQRDSNPCYLRERQAS